MRMEEGTAEGNGEGSESGPWGCVCVCARSMLV